MNVFLLVDEGIEDQNTAINVLSSAFRWGADDGSTFNSGFVVL